MNIYFNRKPVPGPWGGGSKILSSIIDECVARRHNIYLENEIQSVKDLDIIFCIDPRPTEFVTFEDLLVKRNSTKAKLLQRIGDLGTHGKPELTALVAQTCKYADHIVYPSMWAKDLLEKIAKKIESFSIIENAPLSCFIRDDKPSSFNDTIKIVTHHWSNNLMKGFDIYEKLDHFCQISDGKFEFTYIGRKPNNFNFRNYIEPLDANELSRTLKNYHVYLTASKYEAGANHVLEAMAMKLPVLYHRDGGSIVEYCKEYGVMFDSYEKLQHELVHNLTNLENISKRMSYGRNTRQMAKEYVDLFERLSS